MPVVEHSARTHSEQTFEWEAGLALRTEKFDCMGSGSGRILLMRPRTIHQLISVQELDRCGLNEWVEGTFLSGSLAVIDGSERSERDDRNILEISGLYIN